MYFMGFPNNRRHVLVKETFLLKNLVTILVCMYLAIFLVWPKLYTPSTKKKFKWLLHHKGGWLDAMRSSNETMNSYYSWGSGLDCSRWRWLTLITYPSCPERSLFHCEKPSILSGAFWLPSHTVQNSIWLKKNRASDNEGKFHSFLMCRIWIYIHK